MSTTAPLAETLDAEREHAQRQRDALLAALRAATHEFLPGRYGCSLCGSGPDAAMHNTPSKVFAALARNGETPVNSP